MGKIKKTKRTKMATQKAAEITPIMAKSILPLAMSNIVPKDFDLASVRSLKSMKNKFGIKKQITKTEKVKLRKEILKQKIDVIKEDQDMIRHKGMKKKLNKKERMMEKNSEEVTVFNNVKDMDEEYVKLGIKVRGVQKKNKRTKQMNNDISNLKSLMKKVIKK